MLLTQATFSHYQEASTELESRGSQVNLPPAGTVRRRSGPADGMGSVGGGLEQLAAFSITNGFRHIKTRNEAVLPSK